MLQEVFDLHWFIRLATLLEHLVPSADDVFSCTIWQPTTTLMPWVQQISSLWPELGRGQWQIVAVEPMVYFLSGASPLAVAPHTSTCLLATNSSRNWLSNDNCDDIVCLSARWSLRWAACISLVSDLCPHSCVLSEHFLNDEFRFAGWEWF